MGIPDLSVSGNGGLVEAISIIEEQATYAEKSADPVAARLASEERRACQTAPLWPMKVPILL